MGLQFFGLRGRVLELWSGGLPTKPGLYISAPVLGVRLLQSNTDRYLSKRKVEPRGGLPKIYCRPNKTPITHQKTTFKILPPWPPVHLLEVFKAELSVKAPCVEVGQNENIACVWIHHKAPVLEHVSPYQEAGSFSLRDTSFNWKKKLRVMSQSNQIR